MLFDQITIVGVGLIGGSVGLAAKARGVAGRIVGVGRDTRNLARAVELGAIDAFTTDLADGVNAAQTWSSFARRWIASRTSSSRLPRTADRARSSPTPVARRTNIVRGSWRRAAARRCTSFRHIHSPDPRRPASEHARADLFENRVTVLTGMLGGIDPDVERRVEAFWRSLGSRVVRMIAPSDHDRALAATSHLPHAVAAAVARRDAADWLALTAGGLSRRHAHRGGDPELWAAIFQANRDAVLAALGRFRNRLDEFRATPRGRRRGRSRAMARRRRNRCAMLWEVEIRPLGRDGERERVCDEFDLLTHAQRGGDLDLGVPPAASSSKATSATPTSNGSRPRCWSIRSSRPASLPLRSPRSRVTPTRCCSSPA